MAKKVLVLGEVRDGELRNVSFEAISVAKEIAGDGEIVGLVCGDAISEAAKKMFNFGASRVLVVEDEKLKTYTNDGYTQAVMQVIEQEKPEGIVMGHTSLGKDLSPRIAAKATAEVSDPPRPNVVISLVSDIPWKPATITIFSFSNCSFIRLVSISIILAFP